MPRTARRQSPIGIYHVMLRAVNRQQIFYEEEDYRYFEELLEHYKATCGYRLYAYCIMGNHVHLLIRVGEEPPEKIFKRIGSAFVYWYNLKYERTGHLFQDRYKSEPVDNERYFWTVLRYILRNPVAAGFCPVPEQYSYSSAAEYFLGKKGITDTVDVLRHTNETMITDFISQQNDDHCLDIDETVTIKCTDKRARRLIFQEFGTFSPVVGKPKDRDNLNESICRLTEQGVSIRQLSRLTGIPKKVIETAMK